MTSPTSTEIDPRALLERKAELRLMRLGRMFDALSRRRHVLERRAGIAGVAVLGCLAVLVSVVVVWSMRARRSGSRIATH